MRVVMIISGLGVGGAEHSLLNIVREIDPDFHPYVVSLSDEGEIGHRISELGVPVETIGMKSVWSFLPALVRLTRRLRQLRPDVVHTWMYHADFLGGLAARLARIRGVTWGLHSTNIERGMLKERTRKLIRVCAVISGWVPAKIISCSDEAMHVHVAKGYDASKIVVIPNGIDTTRFNPDRSAPVSVREELGIPLDAPLVGLIGRFDIQKNHAGFFDAARIVHAAMPNVHFLLAGSGIVPANGALWDVVQKAGVAEVTHLLGQRDDIPRLMSALDVLASSSAGEAFPLVLGEAMSCEIPCAVTDVGDSAYIVGDTGRVVPPSDMAGLAQAILNLLALPADVRHAIGKRARARIQDNFDLAEVIKKFEQVYEGLARGTPL